MHKVLETIKGIRNKQNLTQAFVAEKLGLTTHGYNLIESGKRSLDIDRLNQIADILNVTIGDLFGIDANTGRDNEILLNFFSTASYSTYFEYLNTLYIKTFFENKELSIYLDKIFGEIDTIEREYFDDDKIKEFKGLIKSWNKMNSDESIVIQKMSFDERRKLGFLEVVSLLGCIARNSEKHKEIIDNEKLLISRSFNNKVSNDPFFKILIEKEKLLSQDDLLNLCSEFGSYIDQHYNYVIQFIGAATIKLQAPKFSKNTSDKQHLTLNKPGQKRDSTG